MRIGYARVSGARPGLREALAACRAGDTLGVMKLDRLARSVPDTRDISDELTVRQVKLDLGGSVHDPTDPVGRLLFIVPAMIAEFESDLIGARTREGLSWSRPRAGSRQATEAVREAGGAGRGTGNIRPRRSRARRC